MMSMPQRATLPICIRQRDKLAELCEVPLKSMYTVSWADIMKYCRATRDVDWLLRGRWERFVNTIRNIFEILFLEHDQFRRLASIAKFSYLSDKPVYFAHDPPSQLVKLLIWQFGAFMVHNGWGGVDPLYNDLEFINETNTILPGAWNSHKRLPGILDMGDHGGCEDSDTSVSGYLAGMYAPATTQPV
jgi:hypothetical protein